jgi:predicted phosphoribosyltransferase
MSSQKHVAIIQRPDLRDKVHVFRNRQDAGRYLAEMLAEFSEGSALVLGIPAGGIAVAAAVAELLHLEVSAAVVSKITPPWNSEWGFGAVAFDGSTVLNESIVPALGMSDEEIAACTDATRQKVRQRVEIFCGGQPPAPAGREVILIDDGLATGITLRAAIQALNHAGACRIVVAVPTGHEESLAELAERGGMATVYCANMRGGRQFCVASAYRHWCDVTSEEASDLLRAARSAAVPARRGGG